MTMTLSSRSITRASALTLAALTFAGCSDSISPLPVSPDQLQAIGEVMGAEIESGAMQLTAQHAMGTVDAPAFSVQSGTPANVGAAFNLHRAAGYPVSLQAVDTECGVRSEDSPTDTDGDQVPDNLTITFALPACRFVDVNGSFELTGVIRVTDPTPGTAAMAFNMALDNFRVTLSSDDLSGFVRRDGLTAVNVTQTGLSQTVSWLESVQFSGFPTIGADIDWSATFAAAEGGTITAGQPLPDGVYVPNGSFDFRQGNHSAHFSVTTVEPLQYSAECAAGVMAGTVLSAFSSGKVRVGVANDGNLGYAEVTYASCEAATVLYVSR
jgi:hypothetical protein